MLRQASSNWPSSAYAFARYDECNGIQFVVPVDRNAAMPEAILWTASEALPISAKRQPCIGVQSAFQNKEPFSSAKEQWNAISTFKNVLPDTSGERLVADDAVNHCRYFALSEA